jgi:hypothetical protein
MHFFKRFFTQSIFRHLWNCSMKNFFKKLYFQRDWSYFSIFFLFFLVKKKILNVKNQDLRNQFFEKKNFAIKFKKCVKMLSCKIFFQKNAFLINLYLTFKCSYFMNKKKIWKYLPISWKSIFSQNFCLHKV